LNINQPIFFFLLLPVTMQFMMASLAFLSVAYGAVIYTVPGSPYVQNGYALQGYPYAIGAPAPVIAPAPAPITQVFLNVFLKSLLPICYCFCFVIISFN
jgi:hypothetical protein